MTATLPAGATVDQPHPSRVLVVDDEDGVVAALARMFHAKDIDVLTAADGPRALAALETHAPSIGVVLSDYAMPGMNGVELLHTVRLRWPEIARVLLTGRADLPAAARAVNDGQVARLFVKPWDPAELPDEITRLMTLRDLTHALGREQLSAEQARLTGQLRTALNERQLR